VSAIAASGVESRAAGLQVSPILVDLPAGSAASTISLNNTSNDEINAQIRVFKWAQVNGTDQLIPTRDVVASPPAAKIAGHGTNVIRIVRLSKAPVTSEETYRLKIDEVPKLANVRQAGVTFAISYSLPVFFTPAGQTPALAWTAKVSKGVLKLEATNTGGRRARLANLKIANGVKSATIAPGLAGYVLSQSKKDWLIKGGSKLAKPGDTIKIVATSEAGPFEATAHVEAAN
jgi:fimbrial chaperone protein